MLAVSFKIFVVLAVVFSVLLPLALLLERRHHAVLRERIGSSREGIDPDVSVWEFLRPLGSALWLLVAPAPGAEGPHRLLRELAPSLAFVSALLGLAMIPFGVGPYLFGESRVSMIVADLDWGILGVSVALGFSQLADVLASWANGSSPARLAALQGSLRMLAGAVALLLSSLGLILCAGSLGLSEIVSGQDSDFRVFGLLEVVSGAGTLSPWLAWLRLPAWGVFLQPLGFVLVLRCAWLATSRPGPVLHQGARPEAEALRSGAFLTAAYLERIVWASAIVALFLGGGGIPYIDQATIIAFVAQAYGEGFATGFTMLVHGGAFFAKVAALVAVLTFAHGRFEAPAYERGMNEVGRFLLPLALLNSLLTALVLVWWDGMQA